MPSTNSTSLGQRANLENESIRHQNSVQREHTEFTSPTKPTANARVQPPTSEDTRGKSHKTNEVETEDDIGDEWIEDEWLTPSS
jgi:hypothetical protein